MIIYFVGKKGSGKSTCSGELIANHGFIKLSFAKPLKQCIAFLYNVDESSLDILEFKEGKLQTPWVWNKEKFQELCAFFSIDANVVSEDRVFNTPREAMQYIGTDILRTIDPNFHINKAIPIIKHHIGLGLNVCLDDVRFINEMSELGKLGGIGIYIDRPGLPHNSHISENELTKDMFNYTVDNNGTKEELLEKFKKIYSGLSKE